MPYSNRIKARFWAKVDICVHGKECSDCCWPWTASKAGFGYGRFHLWYEGESRVRAPAHRVAWELAHNEFISNDLFCCHGCDTPPCVNPAHLWLGTNQDNLDDMRRKGRSATGERHGWRTHPESVPRGERNGRHTHPESTPRGERHYYARLTEAQVLVIRALASDGKHSNTSLAKRYCVSVGAIRHIVNGTTWKHLTLGERSRWNP